MLPALSLTPLAAFQILLALVFLLSGVGKLRSPGSVGDAVRSLGLSESWGRGLLVRLFPWGEVFLAGTLLILPGALNVVSSALALALSVFFLTVVSRALSQGRQGSCACFGSSSAPLSRWSLIRNILLVLFALFALAASLSHGAPWQAKPGSLLWVSAFVALMSAGGAWALLKSELPAGENPLIPQIPAQEAVELEEGEYVRRNNPLMVFRDLRQDQEINTLQLVSAGPAFLMRVSPGCGSCQLLLSQEKEIGESLPGVRVAYVFDQLNGELSEQWRESRFELLQDPAGHFWQMASLPMTPGAIVLGADGLTAAGPVTGAGEIVELARELGKVLRQVQEESSEELI